MAKLLYIVNTSVDGYCEDRDGGINWGSPDEDAEYFGAITDIERGVGTYLYGRRMYEAMRYWETAPVAGAAPWVAAFTDVWRAADKVVYSTTLTSVSTERTTLEPTFDVGAVQRMKSGATRDLTVGGADLAGQAVAAGLVDEYHAFVWPLVLGAGTPALPTDRRIDLQLLDERRLRSGIVHLRYGITR